MGLFGDVLGSFGDLAGLLSGGGADDEAQQYYRSLLGQLKKVDPTIAAQEAAPSDQSAAQDAIRELQQTYRGGGLDAISRAGLAEATNAANRTAQASREAVLEGARARGAGRSGVTLALQQKGGQDAAQDAALAGSRAAATAEGNRLGALSTAGGLGIQSAAAQDAINRFNAAMRQDAAQQTFANKTGQIAQEGQLYSGVYNPALHSEARTSRLWSSLGRMAGGAADAIGKMPSWLQNDPMGGAAYT